MAKTNKEVCSDLAKEMRDKRKEKNTQLEQVEKSNFSEWLKDSMRKEIKENFEKDIDAIKSRPWYEEAKKTHLEEIKAKIRLKKAKKELEDAENSYNEAQVAHKWKVEDEEKESLRGNTDAILRDLTENHVKIEPNVNYMWYEWKKVYIDLPKVGNFPWFKFEYFVSNDKVYKKDFEKKSNLEKKSYSMSDVSKLLQAMNKYMIELDGKNDGDMDYENELKYGEINTYRCNAWDCLKAITWLYDWYWLKDKNEDGIKNSSAFWGCCFFRYAGDGSRANLFLRLSD